VRAAADSLGVEYAPARMRILCALIGHKAAARNSCSCLRYRLTVDGTHTHVRHILSCFVMGHRFERLIDRDGLREYICSECGHQLLVQSDQDPFAHYDSFQKRPCYWCSIFGHHVERVAERAGLIEYLCKCGHSFLKRHAVRKIKHPAICTLAGHFVRFVCCRQGYSEYVCGVCGHAFLYEALP
jgi:DNA-directed RNA polymerase subunit RPC12/RpoP